MYNVFQMIKIIEFTRQLQATSKLCDWHLLVFELSASVLLGNNEKSWIDRIKEATENNLFKLTGRQHEKIKNNTKHNPANNIPYLNVRLVKFKFRTV